MRVTIAALVIVGLPVVVAAQSSPTASSPPLGVPLPLPQIGLPLPSIGLPLPSLGLPPMDSEPRVGKTRPLPETGNQQRRLNRKPSVPTVVYVVPAYGFDYRPLTQAGTPVRSYFPHAPSESQKEGPLIGTLRLEVEPEAVLQLYVDGYYVGTPADFNGEVALEAGPHMIEIRAPGYETLQLDVNIAPARSITYRGSLTPAGVPSPPGPTVQTLPDVAPRTPTTLYFIPGCYVGNVPPKDAGLPATCDQSRVITFKQ